MEDLSPNRADLEPIEIASIDEIRALQLERLRATLNNAYANVEHYRKTFDAAGVHPDDVQDLSDLAKFPFTNKSDLRDNYPSACLLFRRHRFRGFMRHLAPPENRRSWAILPAILTFGPPWLRAVCVHRG